MPPLESSALSHRLRAVDEHRTAQGQPVAQHSVHDTRSIRRHARHLQVVASGLCEPSWGEHPRQAGPRYGARRTQPCQPPRSLEKGGNPSSTWEQLTHRSPRLAPNGLAQMAHLGWSLARRDLVRRVSPPRCRAVREGPR